MQNLCDASPLGFAFFKHNADSLGLMFFQRHTSHEVFAVSTTCASFTRGSVDVADLGEFSFNFGLDANLTSSNYETSCVYGSSGLNRNL